MEHDALSMRQIMVLMAAALLAPAADLLPALTAGKAGAAGWLSALGALPLLLIALWAAGGVSRNGGYGQVLGKIAGDTIIILYMAWILLTLALALRLSGARLTSIYGERFAFGCTAALLIAAVWMGLGKASAFARAGEIFYLALAVALAAVIFLAAFQAEWGFFRVSVEEAADLPGSSLATAGLLLNILPAMALGGRVAVKPRDGRRAAAWTVAFCAAAALLLVAINGSLGPKLTARMPAPFLTMVQGLGIKGAFQRTEALIAALWTLSDLVLIGLLLHAWRDLAGELHPGKWSRWSVIPVAAAALAGGWLLFSGEKARAFCGAALPILGLILGLGVPVIARILCAFKRRKGQGEHILGQKG